MFNAKKIELESEMRKRLKLDTRVYWWDFEGYNRKTQKSETSEEV